MGEPDNEPALKGSRESFVESVRTNTAMVRRHLKAPQLKIKEQIVGRQSRTVVDVLFLDGIADPDTVSQLEERLADLDIDGVEATGNLEEYLVEGARSPFPLMAYTQRPDRFCQGLLEGRVGLLADGDPPGVAGAWHYRPVFQDRTGPSLPLDGVLRPPTDPLVLRPGHPGGARPLYLLWLPFIRRPSR